MSPLWYFAYGSNMSRAIFEERRRMQPLARRIGWIEDLRVCFSIPVGPGERGVANLEPCAGARTWGVAYLLTPEQFDALDRTEGVHLDIYRRVSVIAHVDGEPPLQAFTYQSALIVAGRKPSPRYLGLLLDGARAHGLPVHYIELLQAFELASDERQQP